MVIGDLNATPWSVDFRHLEEAGGLINSQRGHGIQPTYPAFPLAWPMRIAIDHCLHSYNLATLERRVGPALGSDHLPIEVVLGFR